MKWAESLWQTFSRRHSVNGQTKRATKGGETNVERGVKPQIHIQYNITT